MIQTEDLAQLVGELVAQVGPDTEFRWKREGSLASDWYPDDEANLTLQRLFKAWRTYQAAPQTATLSVSPALKARLAALAAAKHCSITSLLEGWVLDYEKRRDATAPVNR